MDTTRSIQQVPPPASLDAALSGRTPFGDSVHIHEQFELGQRRWLESIAISLPVAAEVVAVLDRVDPKSRQRIVGDTVLRCAIRQALRRIVTGEEHGLPLEDCEKILRETVLHVENGGLRSPFEAGAVDAGNLGLEWHDGWVWSEENSGGFLGDAFRNIVQESYGGPLCTPSPDDVAMLRQGARLLAELLPLTSRSALSHVHLVAVFPPTGNWEGVLSTSLFQMGGAVFLGKAMLRNPWCVAEYLLHESLHQKLYDFRHGHSLLVRDSTPQQDLLGVAPARVPAPWNSPGLDEANHWDTFRAVAAFHVYVHLALLSTLAEQRASELGQVYGPLRDARPGMTSARVALDRAHYLGESITQSCWAELGRAGRLFVQWLATILDTLDPSPPPKGASLHLFLHRYLAEGKRLERQPVAASFGDKLAVLSADEVRTTRRIRSELGVQDERFNRALANVTVGDPGKKFSEVRGLIARTLLGLSPDGYGLTARPPASTNLDAVVRIMVEISSRTLAAAGVASENGAD